MTFKTTEVLGFKPDWALPHQVSAWQTCRGEGTLPYGSFNLGLHVGDDPHRVEQHRQQLLQQVPSMPVWLNQVHGHSVVTLTETTVPDGVTADAVMTTQPGQVCAIMTADCLPVLLTDQQGQIVGAAHAGWRGLAGGVIQALVRSMCQQVGIPAGQLRAWLGPAIGPQAFEVGDDVRDVFLDLSPETADSFVALGSGKWDADLPKLASYQLHRLGVVDITLSGMCTYSQSEKFYSYRRDKITGRMASMIWINP